MKQSKNFLQLAVYLCCSVTSVGCDISARGGIALAPHPEVPIDSTMRNAVLASVARVAQRRGFEVFGPVSGAEEGWMRCFMGQATTLCGKQRNSEIQLIFSEFMRGQLSPFAFSVRQEIADTLQAQFGLVQVRECKIKAPPESLIKKSDCKNFDTRMRFKEASE